MLNINGLTNKGDDEDELPVLLETKLFDIHDTAQLGKYNLGTYFNVVSVNIRSCGLLFKNIHSWV